MPEWHRVNLNLTPLTLQLVLLSILPVLKRMYCLTDVILILSSADGLFKLPYRIVFAVATLNSLYIFDTENTSPIAILAGLHYATITDITW